MLILRKSFGPLSSGTRVDFVKKVSQYITVVRLVTPPSETMLKQNHPLIKEMGKSGIFECPTEWLVQRRNRTPKPLRAGELSSKMIAKLLAEAEE